MANTYRIQVITNELVPETGTEYRDAQYFDVPVDTKIGDFIVQKEAEINAEKDARIARYVDAIKNPVIQPESTKEQLEAEAVSIAEQKIALDSRLSEIALKVIAIDAESIEEPVIEEKP